MNPITSAEQNTTLTNYVPVDLKLSKDKEFAISLGRHCNNYQPALSKIRKLSQNLNLSGFNFYQLTPLEFL